LKCPLVSKNYNPKGMALADLQVGTLCPSLHVALTHHCAPSTVSMTSAHRTLSRSLSSSCCPIRPIPCVTQLLTFAEWLASDYGQMEVSRGYYRQHLAHWTAAGIARRWATDGLEQSVFGRWRFFGLLHSSSAPTTAARNTPNTAKFSW